MERIETLSLDLETFSDRDLKKCGVYKYAESPNAELLLFGYSINNGPVTVIDVAQGEKVPEEILKALTDDSVIKWAFNASFERIFLSIWLKRNYPAAFKSYGTPEDTVGNNLNPSSWRCSLVWSAYMGLPLSLKGVGAVLKLDEQKLTEGADLIRYFCVPCKPTISNGGRTRNLPHHAPDKWATFVSYNRRDVEVELGIKEKLKNFPVPEFVWDEYHLDQEINDRGIGIDRELVKNAIAFDERSKSEIAAQMVEKTELENPNSVSQMRNWLSAKGIETDSLGKKAVAELMKEVPEDLAEVLALRQQLAKSSVKKYQAMQNAVCDDGRARGMFQFYGGSRTGRWAGRIIQLQNLRQNHMEDLAEARELVRQGNYEALEMLYDDIPDTLSQLIRTAFIPKPCYLFYVADFSAIEARVIAHLAGETWREEVFREGKDIYCASASQMFHVPVEKHGINGHLRQKGKQAELACIAEGELVLTDKGLIPIEKVTTREKLWDGENWVSHKGVIYKGEKEVIEYEGLRATHDHLVWVKGKSEPVQFGEAASSGAHLLQTGDGGRAIRLGENNLIREALEQELEQLLCSDRVSGVPFNPVDRAEQSEKRENKRMPAVLTASSDSTMAREETHCSKAEMREPKRQELYELRRKRHKIPVRVGSFCGPLYKEHDGNSTEGIRIGQDRQQQELHAGEPQVHKSESKSSKQTHNCFIRIPSGVLALFRTCRKEKAIIGDDKRTDNRRSRTSCTGEEKELESNISKVRLYDIRDAGEHHRFTVSNRLVHNCGYGGSVGALKAMGALEMGLKEEELQPLVDAWRSSNPNIVQLWWDVDKAVKTTVSQHIPTEPHGLKFTWKSGMLFITLPSGRKLSYVKPKMGQNKFGGDSITYEGIGATKKWERLESYGPKFVENIVQAISRDLLMNAMKTLKNYFICAHVHDEMIIECNEEVSLQELCTEMGKVPEWFKGILLRADGYTTPWYRKD